MMSLAAMYVRGADWPFVTSAINHCILLAVNITSRLGILLSLFSLIRHYDPELLHRLPDGVAIGGSVLLDAWWRDLGDPMAHVVFICIGAYVLLYSSLAEIFFLPIKRDATEERSDDDRSDFVLLVFFSAIAIASALSGMFVVVTLLCCIWLLCLGCFTVLRGVVRLWRDNRRERMSACIPS